VGGLTLGCSTSLSGNQPAHVPDPGHAQTEVGFDLSVPAETFGEVVDAAQELEEAAETRELTSTEKLQILEGAAYLTLNPPSVNPHAGIYFSPLRNFEVGARIAGGNLRFGARVQLLHQDKDGVDLSTGIGFGFAYLTPPVEEVLEKIEVHSFSRWTLDVPLMVGTKDSWYRWWAGPRLLYASTKQELSLSLPQEITLDGSVSGSELYLAATVGLAMGYDWIFMGPELTLIGLVGSAKVTGLGSTETVEVSGLIYHPSFAVMMEF